MDGHATIFFFFFLVRPLLFMDGHANIFFFFCVPVHFRSWMDMQPSIFFFFFGVRPFLSMDGVRPLFGLSFFGCGFIEVTKCYLVT